MQAVVDYNGHLDKSERSSLPVVGTTQRLDVGSYSDGFQDSSFASLRLPTGSEVTGVPFFRIPDVGMTAAVVNGLNTGVKRIESTPSFLCPSGNCTWAPYTTLATCSVCNDVTSSLTRNSSYGDSRDLATLTSTVRYFFANFTTYALPYVSITNEDGTDSGISTVYMAAKAIDNPGLTVSFKDNNTIIAAVGIIRPASSYPESRWAETPVQATECALYFCTKAYVARVDNGVFSESVMGAWTGRYPPSYQLESSSVQELNQSIATDFDAWSNYSLTIPEITDFGIRRTDLQLRISEEQAREKGLPPNTTLVFNISQSSAETASYTITDQLFSKKQVTWPMPKKDPGGALSPLVAQTLGTMQTEDYAAIFENMAESLTIFMRDHSNTTESGEQTEWVIYIWIRWEYVILPLIVFIGGCFVLLFTILETRSRGLEPWKSDVLAAFTHSTDAEIQKQLRSAEVKGHARSAAKGLVVKLIDSGDIIELKVKKD